MQYLKQLTTQGGHSADDGKTLPNFAWDRRPGFKAQSQMFKLDNPLIFPNIFACIIQCPSHFLCNYVIVCLNYSVVVWNAL